MAAYSFGEVRAVSSRAVTDEDDDENEQESTDNYDKDGRAIIIRWSPETRQRLTVRNEEECRLHHLNIPVNTTRLKCHNFIIAIESIACSFVWRYLLPSSYKPIGVISCGLEKTDRNSLSQQSLDDTSCFLYELTNSSDGTTTVICMWNLKCTSFQNNIVIQKLFENLCGLNHVFILSNENVREYKSDDGEPKTPGFLGHLTTSIPSLTINEVAPRLRLPSIVTDVPAAVMSYCTIHQYDATVFICYSQDTKLDSTNIDLFRPLLTLGHFSVLHKEFKSLPISKSCITSKTTACYKDHNVYT